MQCVIGSAAAAHKIARPSSFISTTAQEETSTESPSTDTTQAVTENSSNGERKRGGGGTAVRGTSRSAVTKRRETHVYEQGRELSRLGDLDSTQGGGTNEELFRKRVHHARDGPLEYRDEDREANLTDCLTDLKHWSDAHGVDFENSLPERRCTTEPKFIGTERPAGRRQWPRGRIIRRPNIRETNRKARWQPGDRTETSWS